MSKVKEFVEYESVYHSIFKRNKSVNKIAGFDMDSTLIKTKSGKKFPVSEDDWVFNYSNIIDVLEELDNKGFQIVIFTNQGGIGKGKIKKESIFNKINQIRKKVGLTIDAIISTKSDYYRKPLTGMWDLYIETKKGLNMKKVMKYSFYCGDAAGRIYKKGKDFSSSDKYFAHNIGLQFFLPEEAFRQPIPPYKYQDLYDTLDLKEWVSDTGYDIEPSDEQEMIIMVGRPASGKSTFSKKYYSHYGYVNCDILKTKAKCLKEAKKWVVKGESVIIDNTNGDLKTRNLYANIAKEYGLPIKIYVIEMPFELSKHMNNFRVQTTKGEIKKIPDVAYNVYRKRYEDPTEDEGEIIRLPFKAVFEDEEELEQFFYHY